jgi:CRP-like cAMP-binding protein
MEYNDVKRCLLERSELARLDESTAAALLWRGQAQTLEEGEIIYAEGTTVDDTFCLLLSGDLVVEKDTEAIGGIGEGEIFGEMAYFTNWKARTATVRVGSPQAVVLRFQLTPQELAEARFSSLRTALALQTWQKFVSASQGQGPCQEKK